MSTFRASTIKGVSWSIIDQVFLQITNIFISVVLARLLSPKEFGLIGMAAIVTGFIAVIKDFGLGSAVVQRKNIQQNELNTIFSFNIIVGFILFVAIFFSAPLLSHFYNEPALVPLIRVLAFSFIISSFGAVSDNLLLKSISFKQIFIKNLFSSIMAGTVAILMALNGFTYWSLVGQIFVSIFFNVAGSFYFSRFKPALQLNPKVLKSFWKFSFPLLGEQSMNYWVRNIDNLLIGKYLGSVELGLYSKAYSLMLLPVRQISGTIMRVMFPSFSLIQHDVAKVGKIYLKICKLVAFIAVPLMCSLAVAAYPIILLLYGSQWIAIVPIFQMLCFLGLIQSIGTLSGSIFISQGQTAMLFKIGIFCKSLMITGIVVGLFMGGLMGVAIGYSISGLIAFIIETYFVGTIIKVPMPKIMKSIWPEVSVGLFTGAVLYITLNLFLLEVPILLQVVCLGFEGLIVWGGLAQLLKMESWLTVKSMVLGRL